LVVFVDLVGVNESNWDELNRFTGCFRRSPLHDYVRLKVLSPRHKIKSISALDHLRVFRKGCGNDPSIPGRDNPQLFDPAVSIGVGLRPNPIRIRITRSYFTARQEKAFRGAFEVCLKKAGGDIHLQLEVLGSATKMDFCYPHDSSFFWIRLLVDEPT